MEREERIERERIEGLARELVGAFSMYVEYNTPPINPALAPGTPISPLQKALNALAGWGRGTDEGDVARLQVEDIDLVLRMITRGHKIQGDDVERLSEIIHLDPKDKRQLTPPLPQIENAQEILSALAADSEKLEVFNKTRLLEVVRLEKAGKPLPAYDDPTWRAPTNHNI